MLFSSISFALFFFFSIELVRRETLFTNRVVSVPPLIFISFPNVPFFFSEKYSQWTFIKFHHSANIKKMELVVDLYESNYILFVWKCIVLNFHCSVGTALT